MHQVQWIAVQLILMGLHFRFFLADRLGGNQPSGGGIGHVWARLVGIARCFHVDNTAAVSVVQTRSAKDPHLVQLLHCLFLYIHPAQLEITKLETTLQSLLGNAVATTTHTAYQTGLRRYLQFFGQYRLQPLATRRTLFVFLWLI